MNNPHDISSQSLNAASHGAVQIPPDFDAYVQDKMLKATTFLSRPIEAMFTCSVIFSMTLTPFVMFQALCPELMVILISTSWVFILIPYILIMTIIGLKVASLFGCSAWSRITSAFRE